jgi:hypothetical protein
MPEQNFSLIDLKALSEPAVKLIEAVRSAVGILYEPTQIRRKARAEADAAIILARNQGQVSEIEVRASERVINRELRRQKNIEEITRKALKALPDKVNAEKPDEDWIHSFFESCQDVSNEDMQILWSRILAGEVATPGTFSTRAVGLIKHLQRSDAELFTKFCTFVWFLPGIGLAPIIPSVDDSYLKERGLHFLQFMRLEEIGLIQFNNVTGFSIKRIKQATAFYYGRRHDVSREDESDLTLGKALLTSVGSELAPIAGAEHLETYRENIVAEWQKAGFTVNVVAEKEAANQS